MKPGDLVRIKDTPPLVYQGIANKIGLIVKKNTEYYMYVVLVEEKLVFIMNHELDKLET